MDDDQSRWPWVWRAITWSNYVRRLRLKYGFVPRNCRPYHQHNEMP